MKKEKDVFEKISEKTGKLNNILNFLKNCRSILAVFIPVAPSVIFGIITKNWEYALILLSLCLGAAVVILAVMLIREHSNMIEGTFAVSAFIFYGKDNKLLMYKSKSKSNKEHSFYVQPSVFYKRKRKKGEDHKLLTPYNKIYSYLNDELGLYMEHLKPISYLPLKIEHQWIEQSLSNFIRKNKEVLFLQYGLSDVEKAMRKYKDNEISLSPLLTIVEKNPDALKSSGEPFHIDFYYAFRLSESDIDMYNNSDDLKIVSRKELKDMLDHKQTHGDLLAVYDTLRYLIKRVESQPRVEINNCTFSCRKKTAYWRITEYCNCNCIYCFIGKEKQKADDEVDEETIEKVIQIIEDNDIEKLVISGGEPLLVNNLLDVIRRISNVSNERLKISVCTNGVTDFADLDSLSLIPQFEKFVVSIDGYNQKTYGKYKTLKGQTNGKRPKQAQLNNVKRFIENAQRSRINIAINTIISKDLLENTDKYIELFNSMGIEELSLSALISNNDRNKDIENFVTETGQIINFYNTIINDKMDKFDYLKKLDFVIPSCTYSSGECDCLKQRKLLYISPKGDMLKGCMEKRS